MTQDEANKIADDLLPENTKVQSGMFLIWMGERRKAISAALVAAEERGRNTYKYTSDAIIASGLCWLRLPNGDTKLAAPKDHILCPDGVVRKVLGTLAMTKDGFVVGELATVWVWTDSDGLQKDSTDRLFCRDFNMYPVEYCYSTRAAAESAARGEGKQ